MSIFFVFFPYINGVRHIFKCVNDTLIERVNDTLIERVQGTIVCVQGTAVCVSRARLYTCPGHDHRTRLANVTETHFNQTIVLWLGNYN